MAGFNMVHMAAEEEQVIFSNDTFDGNKVMDDAAFLLWSWLRGFEKDFTVHFNQWSSNISQSFMY